MSRRRLSADERALWKGFTRSIPPLRKSDPDEPDTAEPAAREVAVRPQKTPKPQSKPQAKLQARPPVAVPARVAAPPAPPLVPLGRRLKKRVARGARTIDGRLDLHGMTQAEAYSALSRFLRTAQARGDRIVLVITGKGARASEDHGERGVLKRQVPLWLRLPEFRGYIVGFENAGIGHGGEGALYVSLRKARGD
jgi:DNA-nicking Smr family endonuclease